MTDLFGQTTTMKAVSLWQPWASLVARGLKIDETRHWATQYRGPIAIHAAKTLDLAGAPDRLCADAFGPYWTKTLPRGVVVCVAELYDCRPAEEVADHLSAPNLAAGNFARGRFAWRLRNIRRLIKPLELTGRQGLFNWTLPHDLEGILGPVIDHAAAVRHLSWDRPAAQPGEAA